MDNAAYNGPLEKKLPRTLFTKKNKTNLKISFRQD